MPTKFQNLFKTPKPIIGMIHLAGDTRRDIVGRAIREIYTFASTGVNGAIVEDYHTSSLSIMRKALKELSGRKPENFILGINCLQSPSFAFNFARDGGARFIQMDSVQGDKDTYSYLRECYPDIVVLGGVRFKYTRSTGRTLEEDLEQGMQRCDAIVTTGGGTGIETPLEKLIKFRKRIGDFPLIAGAGVTSENVYEQLLIADGAIVGSDYKPDNDTTREVDPRRVRKSMKVVRKLRTDTA